MQEKTLMEPVKQNEKDPQQVSRRTFLKTASAAAAAAAASGWPQSQAFALAPPRVIGANDRINVGYIGLGRHATGRGLYHLTELKGKTSEYNIANVAMCDIYDGYINNARKNHEFSDNKVYRDYRKLLEDKDVDAVFICTPEHWHAIQAIEAMEAGKDVYCEKPVTRYAEEVWKLLDVQKRTKRVVQVGSQGCSDPKWTKAGELIDQGKLGQILWAQGSYCRNNPGGEWNYEIEQSANPSNLDWDKFVGPAPKRPFDLDRFFRWRKYWDYSSGIVSDLFPHRFHPLLLTLGRDAWPVRVVSSGGQYNPRSKKDRDVADTVMVLVDFVGAKGPFTVMLAGCTENQYGLEDAIRGQKATILMGGNKIELRPERPFADEIDAETINIGGERIEPHHKNFFDCVRSRERTNCDAELGARVQTAVHLAERAYRENKCMLFDPKTRKVTAS
jgi:predicted dehydrogenase